MSNLGAVLGTNSLLCIMPRHCSVDHNYYYDIILQLGSATWIFSPSFPGLNTGTNEALSSLVNRVPSFDRFKCSWHAELIIELSQHLVYDTVPRCDVPLLTV